MAKTVFDAASREALLARVMSVETGMKPRWGRMNAVTMLRHIAAGLEIALGEVRCKPRSGPLRNPLLRWIVIDSGMPWPKGAPTAPEMLALPTAGVEEEQARFRAKLERVATLGAGADFHAHPAFGRMSGAQWGRLMWRHVDHHMRQFGV